MAQICRVVDFFREFTIVCVLLYDIDLPLTVFMHSFLQIVIDNEHILVLGGCGGPNKVIH